MLQAGISDHSRHLHQINKGNIMLVIWIPGIIVILVIFIGMIIQMIVLAFASRTNVLFFWIYVLLGIVILIISVVVSNVWQEIAQQSEFATTILRFPITNTILGTYYQTFITGFLFLGLIFIFGKFPGQTED